MIDIDRERERQRHRRREKQAPCQEPNVGLDPGIPGSHPGPKAGAQPLPPRDPRIEKILNRLYTQQRAQHETQSHNPEIMT